MILRIPGIPVAWKRPGKSKHGHRYDTQKAKKAEYQMMMKVQCREQGLKKLISGPVELQVVFFMPMADGWPEKEKREKKGKEHIYVPDLDNMLKFVKDCMKGVVYTDDKLVWSGSQKKIYGEEARTEIAIVEGGRND